MEMLLLWWSKRDTVPQCSDSSSFLCVHPHIIMVKLSTLRLSISSVFFHVCVRVKIQLLARFGQIMFINTLVSIVLTSTACCALLSCQPQWRFPGTWKASFGGFIASGVICGLLFLALYLIHLGTGVGIPAPDGSSLF